MKDSMHYSLAEKTREKTEIAENGESSERVILAPPPDTFPTFQELLSQQNIDTTAIAVQSQNIAVQSQNIAVQSNTPQESVEIPFPVPTPTLSPLLATQIFSILSPTAMPLVPTITQIIEPPTFPEPPPPLPPLPITLLANRDTPDDLLLITGITPIIQQLLEEAGIVSYQQLIEWSDADTERLGSVSLTIMPRMRRFDWQGQARDLYEEKYGQNL
jgi:hypothetical protein